MSEDVLRCLRCFEMFEISRRCPRMFADIKGSVIYCASFLS